MILRNNEPHQMYVQVNALGSWGYELEPTGIPCPHEWDTVRYVTNYHDLICVSRVWVSVGNT